jgi:hypothetical protein
MKTVFVIGAGASKELGMPTGEELEPLIADCFNFDTIKLSRLDYDDPKINPIEGAMHYYEDDPARIDKRTIWWVPKVITNALPWVASIDNLIYEHSGDSAIAVCAKMAITYCILNAESQSLLYTQGDNKPATDSLENTYLMPLFKLLTEGCTFSEFKRRLYDITFVVFNYDRCLEKFLSLAINIFYAVPTFDVYELLKNMHIYHAYGKVGKLPLVPENDGIAFGARIKSSDIYKISKTLHTFTESVDSNSNEYKKIVAAIKEANQIIYLGFAYHEQNMDYLYPQKIERTLKQSNNWESSVYDSVVCYGTAMNIAAHEYSAINSMLFDHDNRLNLDKGINLFNGTCKQFFDEYQYSLRLNR